MTGTPQPTRRHRAVRRSDLPEAFNAKRPADSFVAPLIRSFLAAPTRERRDALATAHLPMVMAFSFHLHQAGRVPLDNDVEETISDACLGLLLAIDEWPRKLFASEDPKRFQCWVRSFIVRHVWNAHRDRTWCGHASDKKALVKRIRRQYVRQLGRLPTAAEVSDYVTPLITNPNIEVFRRARVVTVSQDDDVARDVADVVDRGRAVGAAAVDRETIRLALRGLGAEERKIFKLILAGEGTNAIASKLGISQLTATHRINGVLWQCRSNADLARCLGVVEEPIPPKRLGKYLLSPKNLPPAKLAV